MKGGVEKFASSSESALSLQQSRRLRSLHGEPSSSPYSPYAAANKGLLIQDLFAKREAFAGGFHIDPAYP